MPDLTVSTDVDEFMQSSDEAGMRTAISFNSESRAQTEAMLVQGTNITLTPAGSGDSRTLTIAAAGSSFDPASPGAIGGTTPAAGSFTTLSASSTVSGAGFTARFAAPGPIGSTTPSTGSFTTLSASSGVGGTPALTTNVPDGGANISMRVGRGGFYANFDRRYIQLNSDFDQTYISLSSGGVLGVPSLGVGTSNGTPDTILLRESANTLALRNGANAQTFRAYNTYTDASNYERAKFGWNSNVLEIGTEEAGTGSFRLVRLLGIPAADPAVAGCLWNDAGTLKISAG